MIKVIGHRGMGTGEAENSLLSMVRAMQIGADGIETDVRLTADKVMVLSHDSSLKRVLGVDINVEEHSFKELKKMKLVNDEQLCTVESLYLELPEEAIINIEIKDPEVAEFIVPLVKSFGALERTIFSSFIHDCLLRVREADSSAKIGLLIGEDAQGRDPEEYLTEKIMKYRPYSFHLPVQLFDYIEFEKGLSLLKNLKARGPKIAFWTIDDPELMVRLRSVTDMAITDNINGIMSVTGGKRRKTSGGNG